MPAKDKETKRLYDQQYWNNMDPERRAARLAYQREWRRKHLLEMPPEKIEELRAARTARQKEWRRKRFMEMTPEKRAEFNAKRAECRRKRLASLSPEQLKAYYAAGNKRSPEQARRSAELSRIRRENRTPEQRGQEARRLLEYRQANKDRVLKYAREYRQANKDKMRSYLSERRMANRDKANARQTALRDAMRVKKVPERRVCVPLVALASGML